MVTLQPHGTTHSGCDNALLPICVAPHTYNPAPCPPPGSLFLQPLTLSKAFLKIPTWVRSPFAWEYHFPPVYRAIACWQVHLLLVSGPPSASFLCPWAYRPGRGTQYLPCSSLLISLNRFLRPFLRSLHDFWLKVGKGLVFVPPKETSRKGGWFTTLSQESSRKSQELSVGTGWGPRPLSHPH